RAVHVVGSARLVPPPATGPWLASRRPIQSSRETWLVDAAATRPTGAPARTDGGAMTTVPTLPACPGPGGYPEPHPGWGPATHAVHSGHVRTGFQETSEALFLTQGFVYDAAADAEAAFSGELDRFTYARYENPTVSTFEERLRALEGAEACTAT